MKKLLLLPCLSLFLFVSCDDNDSTQEENQQLQELNEQEKINSIEKDEYDMGGRFNIGKDEYELGGR